jgi:hypothetical protein
MTAATTHRQVQLIGGAVLTAAATAQVGQSPVADPARTLRALVLPFGPVGRTSAGDISVAAGAVHWPDDLRRVKLLAGHDREAPVGYLSAITADAVGVWADLTFANTPAGDVALLEATEGARDAVSVELEDVELDDQDTVVSAGLVAVALVSLPAFSDARIAAQLAVGTAGWVTAALPPDDDDDDDDDDTDDDDDEAPGPDQPVVRIDTYVTPHPTEGNPAVTPTAPAVQAAQAPAAITAARTRARSMTLEAAAATVADRFRRSDRSAAALNAALADITPTSTGYAAVAPYQWLGELWTPAYQDLGWANAVSSGVLTSMKLTGWKRTPPGPQIQPYAGNKAAIPTDGTLGFAPVTVDAVRHAVGADFDRVWIDFGDESVITTWLQLVTQSYAQVVNDALGDLIQAEATAVVAPLGTDVIGQVRLAASTLQVAGASVSYIALAADLFADYLDIPTAEAPWWLTGSSSVSLSGSTANVNDLRVFQSVDLPNGTVVAGDRRAVTHYQPRGNPFTVRAVDLPKGGMDVAVFGYTADLVNDPLGLVSVTVSAVAE